MQVSISAQHNRSSTPSLGYREDEAEAVAVEVVGSDEGPHQGWWCLPQGRVSVKMMPSLPEPSVGNIGLDIQFNIAHREISPGGFFTVAVYLYPANRRSANR